MRALARTLALGILVSGMIAASVAGHSYAYNPWTTMMGAKTLGINPFVYASSFDPFTMGADLVVSYGFTDNIDLFVDLAGVNLTPEFGYNTSWIMPRIDLGGNNIIAIQAGLTAVSPQYHFFWENDLFAAEANLYVSFAYDSFGTPLIGAYLAPVVKIVKDVLALYCEVNPSYQVEGSFALNIVPGIFLNMGDAGQLSVGVPLGDVLTGLAPGVGLWYFLPVKF